MRDLDYYIFIGDQDEDWPSWMLIDKLALLYDDFYNMNYLTGIVFINNETEILLYES